MCQRIVITGESITVNEHLTLVSIDDEWPCAWHSQGIHEFTGLKHFCATHLILFLVYPQVNLNSLRKWTHWEETWHVEDFKHLHLPSALIHWEETRHVEDLKRLYLPSALTERDVLVCIAIKGADFLYILGTLFM